MRVAHRNGGRLRTRSMQHGSLTTESQKNRPAMGVERVSPSLRGDGETRLAWVGSRSLYSPSARIGNSSACRLSKGEMGTRYSPVQQAVQ